MIGKFGTSKVTAFSTLLTAIALIGFSLLPNIWCMVLLAVPLGIGAGAIDVALNNYVAIHYFGMSVFPYYLLVFFAAMLVITVFVRRLLLKSQTE